MIYCNPVTFLFSLIYASFTSQVVLVQRCVGCMKEDLNFCLRRPERELRSYLEPLSRLTTEVFLLVTVCAVTQCAVFASGAPVTVTAVKARTARV